MKSPGQLAYEADVARRPTYDDGSPRKRWEQLDANMQWSWQRPDGGDRENPAQLAKDRRND